MKSPDRAPVRVLIVCDHIDFDGALHGGGRQLIELVRALDRRQVEPTVCVLRGASPLGAQLRDEGLPIQFLNHARFSPASLVKLLEIIRRRDIEVAHLTDFGASTFGRIAARLAGVPSVVQVISHHGQGGPRGFPRYVELTYRALAPLTDHALAISDSVRDFAVARMGFAYRTVEVLANPLPTHSFRPATFDAIAARRAAHGIAPGEPVIGAVTRFHPVKGIRYLIDAFAMVLRAHPLAWLVLVGSGPLEALALGVPVVASNVGGVDGKTGVLVEPANAGALSAALVRLLDDPQLRARLGAAGRSDVGRFSLDRYAGRLTEIYRRLAAERARRRAHAGEALSEPSTAR